MLLTKKKLIYFGSFLAVVLLAAFFRFFNLNWDSGFYLHPDERFLTMVGVAMQIPKTFAEYLSPATSTMNPTNINYSFYVYGVFPLIMNKFLAIQLHDDIYGSYGVLGRGLSATFDMLTLFFVFKTGQIFEWQYKIKAPFALIAAFFYGIAVEPIQLAHFFTVDPYLTTFCTMTLYFSLLFALEKKLWAVPLVGIALGLAIASKVSAIYMLPVFGICLYLGSLKIATHGKGESEVKHFSMKWLIKEVRTLLTPKAWGYTILATAAFGIGCYIVIRLAAPYYFETSNFLDLTINTKFKANIEQLKSFESYDGYFPPAIQWMNKPVTYQFTNLSVFGLGIPYFLLVLIGIGYLLRRHRSILIYSIIGWTVCYFAYQSISFTKVMRYLCFIYPILALFAATGFLYVSSRRPKWVPVVLIAVSLIWPLMFMNIYMHPHSRVEASYWIDKNLENGADVLNESWDDGLPLLVPGYTKVFKGENVEIFAPDVPEKWDKMNDQLKRADYYFMTSNRAWGSIPTVAYKYPKTVPWYNDFFSGKTGYKKIKEFTTYPSLEWLGIPLTLPDQWSDESFTVYDHPKVMIFKNMNKSY
jgi:hypothetical protein